MSAPKMRISGESRAESTGTNRDPHHESREEELIHKLPDEASPDQERGERHAIGKRTATGGATTDDVSEPSVGDWGDDPREEADEKA